MPITPSETIWMDGKLVPWDEARVHVLTHSLHYGSGVFEGIRAYPTKKGPAIFRLTEHIARLYRSAKIYTIEIPYMAEASGENIFIARDGELITPPLSAGALVGITRDSVIRIARDLGVNVHEADLMRTDLYTADEVFVCGTAAEITPVREVDDRVVGEPGPLTKKIQEVFHSAVRGEVERYAGWLEYVS